MKMFDRSLAGDGVVYSLVVTFMALFAFSCVYPAFKQILIMSIPGMGDVEALIITAIPFCIFLSILWSVTFLIRRGRT